MRVRATREGLLGDLTSSGYRIDAIVSFVALPSFAALGKHIKVTNPENGKSAYAEVLDVGPWNTHDDEYVFKGARPQAESGISISGEGTNSAGIDLGEKVWHTLGMCDNSEVDWQFLP